MGKRRLRVAMDELLDAVQTRDDGVTPFFNVRTGAVDLLLDHADSDQLDPDDPDWVRVPRVESHEAFAVMERFVDGAEEPDVQRLLRVALQGRGAFRRFRETLLDYPDLRERFEAARREDLLRRALRFLDALGVEPEYELRPVAPAPTPATREDRAVIELHHVLLLGSPDGETERIEGRVARVVTADTPAQARTLFERLAREIAEQQGLGWRRRFVEGRDTFELAPFRLELHGTVVRLTTAVPPAVWDAFRR